MLNCPPSHPSSAAPTRWTWAAEKGRCGLACRTRLDRGRHRRVDHRPDRAHAAASRGWLIGSSSSNMSSPAVSRTAPSIWSAHPCTAPSRWTGPAIPGGPPRRLPRWRAVDRRSRRRAAVGPAMHHHEFPAAEAVVAGLVLDPERGDRSAPTASNVAFGVRRRGGRPRRQRDTAAAHRRPLRPGRGRTAPHSTLTVRTSWPRAAAARW